MTIRHISIFIAVYQTGSVTHAAEKLYLSQPAVTRAIKDLESYYNVVLFERIRNRLSVTEAGKRFYTYALHIADAFRRCETELRAWDGKGVIRVGASATIGSVLLPKVIRAFKEAHPDSDVRAVVANGETLTGALLNNDLDIALIEGAVSGDDLTAEEFDSDRLLPIVPPDSPLLREDIVFFADIASLPLLLREKGSVCRELVDRIYAMRGMQTVPVMESVTSDAIIEAVHQGLGVSYLPERLVCRYLSSGYIGSVLLRDEDFRRKSYIVYHNHKLFSSAERDFLSLCREIAEREG